MDKDSVDNASYTFASNDSHTGQVWITLEPDRQNLKILSDGVLFLQLRDGIDIRQAAELAKQLNDMVDHIQHVCFAEPAR